MGLACGVRRDAGSGCTDRRRPFPIFQTDFKVSDKRLILPFAGQAVAWQKQNKL
jgi:hypothetical protein